MIGGWFDQHPWSTFNAPIINEAPDFPAVRHFPKSFVKFDEIYQPKAWSRDKVNVLLSLDPSRLDYSNNPRIHRTDHDFAVAWSKMYGKGRVFYSTLGHTEESWQDPDIRKMYFEAIRWALGMTEGALRPIPSWRRARLLSALVICDQHHWVRRHAADAGYADSPHPAVLV